MKAIISIEDVGDDDEVRVHCSFEPEGANDDSAAHRTAAAMLRIAIEDGQHDEAVACLREAIDYLSDTDANSEFVARCRKALEVTHG